MSEQSHQGRIAGTNWDPDQYLTYSNHRMRPALELLDRIPLASPKVVYDLGCGTGHMARIFAESWPSARVFGLDNSKDMLGKAAAEPGNVRWLEADIRNWRPGAPADLIYSNAALQWVEDHSELFPRLVGFLAPGGYLAVQMPLSWDAPSHRLMRETLANGGLDGTALGTAALRQAMAVQWVENAEVYYDMLAGCTNNLDIWQVEYLQILEGKDPVLEWVKGTGLRPILSGLDDKEREVFLEEYTRRMRVAYPVRDDGRTLYPFRRLFIVAGSPK